MAKALRAEDEERVGRHGKMAGTDRFAKRMRSIDHQQHREERRRQATAVLDDDEALLSVAVGRGHEPSKRRSSALFVGSIMWSLRCAHIR